MHRQRDVENLGERGEGDVGDWVLTERVAYRLRAPRRFELVAYRTPDGIQVMKRVAALPGLIERLKTLRPEDWQRTARHDEYNAYSVFIMFRHLALHDFLHAYRIEELLLRPDGSAEAG